MCIVADSFGSRKTTCNYSPEMDTDYEDEEYWGKLEIDEGCTGIF